MSTGDRAVMLRSSVVLVACVVQMSMCHVDSPLFKWMFEHSRPKRS
jgi:hypothetical protein